MKKCLFFLMFALAACSSASDPAPYCVDPAQYGALPDDNQDDRPGVQAAIDAQAGPATICFRSGKYLFTRPPGAGTLTYQSIRIEKPGIRLTGQGLATRLEMSGDGRNGDWRLINIRSMNGTTSVPRVEIDNLQLAIGNAFNTEEQTHLIQLGTGPTDVVSLHHLWFDMPQRPLPTPVDGRLYEKGGDCIRLLGDYNPAVNVDKRVINILIESNQFAECERSSVSFQRAVYNALVKGNIFRNVSDQHIDMEPSGVGGLGQIIIDGNLFLGGRQGDYHVTVTGNGTTYDQQALNITMNGNVLFGRGIMIYNVRHTTITNNIIDAKMQSEAGVIRAIKTNNELIIANNSLHRQAGSAVGPVIKISGHNSGFPNRVSVTGNMMTNDVNGHVVDMESVADVTVNDNDLVFGGPTANTYSGVMLRATGRIVDYVMVSNNRVGGTLANVIRLSASPLAIGTVVANGNMSYGTGNGLRCEGAGGFTKPIVHSGYLYDGAATASVCTLARVVSQYP